MFDCVLHTGLCEWAVAIMKALGLETTSTAALVLRGIGRDQDDQLRVDALRSAVAMAMRRSRAYILMHHAPMRAHGGAIVDEARREMRQSVAIDWTHATTMQR